MTLTIRREREIPGPSVARFSDSTPMPPLPLDLASGTLVYAAQSLRLVDGLDPKGTLWIAEQATNGQDRLEAVVAPFSTNSRAQRLRVTYPPGTGAAGVSYYTGDAIDAFRGNLLVEPTMGGLCCASASTPETATRLSAPSDSWQTRLVGFAPLESRRGERYISARKAR